MLTHEFDITEEAHFKSLARSFGLAMRFFEKESRTGISYAGKTLYHPFLIAIEGPPAGGKSTFIELAALTFAELVKDQGLTLQQEPLKKYWPDDTGHRDVKVWMRWLFKDVQGNPFEIRSDDRLAVDCLYDQHPDVALPTIEMPHVRFREWPDEDFLENSRIVITIFRENNHRLLKISIDPELEADKILDVLTTNTEAISTPCLTSSIFTVNEPDPAF
ncbi:MAG: hypothetical protein LRZ85_00640 [Alphaproteobacteria bacterium]|nr:hypothetical protein [Alphaproteobacteria bacterium]MCD8570890.1 hypothetical protein [Alphaproteobacteria bacterium]